MNRERECNGLVVVKSGQLRAFVELENGKEITLYRLLSRDICILTASCVLKNITFEVTLEVEKDSEVYFIPALIWKKLAEENAAVREFSMELVAERFSEVMWVMEQMVSKNMGQRIAAFLLEQSVLEDSRTLAVTHDTIAKNVGTAREVVSRSLKYLENDGLLKLSRGRIEMEHAQQRLLRRYAGPAPDYLSVFDDDKRRDAYDRKLRGQLRVFIDIQLGHDGGILQFIRKLFDDGRLHPAGAAPSSPEVDEDRLVGIQNDFIQIIAV